MNKLSDRVIADLNDLLQRTHAKRGALESDMAALGVITEEYHEVIDSMRNGESWKIRAELLDLANGCIRRVLAVDGEQAQGHKPVAEEPAPITDAEKLAKIAREAYYQGDRFTPWEECDGHLHNSWLNAVTAVIRAARPTLRDIEYSKVEDLIAVGGGANYAPLWDYVESRIRYGVELPTDESDIATAAYMLGKHDGKTAECQTCARVRAALEESAPSRKARLDEEARQIKREADELRAALEGK